jgi:hypothetical protein
LREEENVELFLNPLAEVFFFTVYLPKEELWVQQKKEELPLEV